MPVGESVWSDQYEALWRRHGAQTLRQVRRVATRYGLSEEDAQDVLQETRLALFRALPRLGLCSPDTFLRGTIEQYVRGIVARRAADAARGLARERLVAVSKLGDGELDLDDAAAAEGAAEDVASLVLAQLEAAAVRGQLRRAVERLPDKQRVAVELVWLREAKYAQAAQVLGVSPGTVKSQVHDALVTLRRWAKAEGWCDEAG